MRLISCLVEDFGCASSDTLVLVSLSDISHSKFSPSVSTSFAPVEPAVCCRTSLPGRLSIYPRDLGRFSDSGVTSAGRYRVRLQLSVTCSTVGLICLPIYRMLLARRRLDFMQRPCYISCTLYQRLRNPNRMRSISAVCVSEVCLKGTLGPLICASVFASPKSFASLINIQTPAQ